MGMGCKEERGSMCMKQLKFTCSDSGVQNNMHELHVGKRGYGHTSFVTF